MANNSIYPMFEFLHELYKHHRKFTILQKSIFLFISLICISIFSCYFRTVALLYTLAISCTVYFCENPNLLHGKAVIISEYVLCVFEIVLQIREILHPFYIELKNFYCRSERETHNECGNSNSDFLENEINLSTEFYDLCDNVDEHKCCNSNLEENSSLGQDHPNGIAHLTVDQKLNGEIERFINLILRDFIQSWYKRIGSNPDILDECSDALHLLSSAITLQISGLHKEKLLTKVIAYLHNHIRCVQIAKAVYSAQRKSKRRLLSTAVSPLNAPPKSRRLSSVEEAFELQFSSVYHPALKNSATEICYIEGVLKLLITKLLPDSYSICTGASVVLSEILTHNVVIPVLHLLSEPDFLYDSLIRILSRDEPIIVDTTCENDQLFISLENACESECFNQTKNICRDDKLLKDIDDPPSTSSVKVSKSSEQDVDSHDFVTETNSFGKEVFEHIGDDENDQNTFSHFDSNSQEISESDLLFQISIDNTEKQKEEIALKQLFNNVPTINNLESSLQTSCEEINIPYCTESRNADRLSPHRSPRSSIHSTLSDVKFDDSRKALAYFALENHPSATSSSTGSTPPQHIFNNPLEDTDYFSETEDSAFFIGSADSNITEQENYPGSLDLPLSEQPYIFKDVKIDYTETAQEARSSSFYTLYAIEYEALLTLPSDDFVNKTGCVKRRFREFVNLKGRLDDNPLYKNSLRDVQGPKRLSLPFFNMDKDSIENRRKVLDNFLKSLIAKEDICNGAELKEFLAHEGDAHIAFVRKASESQVPRIDQMLVRTMSGMLDKIASIPSKAHGVLPSLSGKKEEVMTKKDKDGKILDDNHRIDLDCSCSRFEQMHSDDGICSVMTEFIDATEEDQLEARLQETLDIDKTELVISSAEWQDEIRQKMPRLQADGSETPDKLPTEQGKNVTIENTIPMMEAILDLGTRAIPAQDSWICKKRAISIVKLILGKTLESLIKKAVDFYTSTEKILYYLQQLREVVWPNGRLSNGPRKERNVKQKQITKKQATKCLSEFLPGLLKAVVGEDDIGIAVNEVIESLQYEKLNRHLVFMLLDLLLERLFPELSTHELQMQLLQ